MKATILWLMAAASAPTDQWLTKPVDDRTFQTYLQFFVYDRQTPFDLRVLDTQQQEGIAREHLSFQSSPGVRVTANLYRPNTGAPQGAPAMIVLHGGNARGKDAPFVPALAGPWVRLGWMVLAIDLQYFGERATDLLTSYTEQEKAERLYNQHSGYLAWAAQTVKDVGRSIDLLVSERGADPKRIGLFGISRGAALGTITAAAERRLAAVVLYYGGHMSVFERSHLPAACPANYIGRISPRPLLLLNGAQDATFPQDSAVQPFHRLARSPKQILWADTGHTAPGEEQRAAIVKWLRENLK